MEKDELDGLSEEERAALDAPDDDAAALKSIADENDDDDDAGKAGDDDDKGEDDDSAVAAKAGKGDAGTTADGDADLDDDNEPKSSSDTFVPTFEATLPENFEEQITALKTREEAADEKFESNEISHAEYRKELREVVAERSALEQLKLKADMTEDYNKQIGRQRWLWEADRFMDEAKKDDGIDYKADKGLHKQLDMAVRMVAQSEEAKSYTSLQILAEAHSWVKARAGNAAPATKSDDKAAATKADGKPAARKPNLAAVPKTLGDIPAADRNETGEDEFAELDRLDGMELENALALLPKEKQARYLKAAG